MAFYEKLKILHVLFTIRLLVVLATPATTQLEKQNLLTKLCQEDHSHCGDLKIQYPFGVTQTCSLGSKFIITCDQSSEPPKAFLPGSNLVVRNITLDGELEILQKLVARDCYDRFGTSTRKEDSSVWFQFFEISDTRNKLVAFGCDANATLNGFQGSERFTTSCKSQCRSKTMSLCQSSIAKGLHNVTVSLSSSPFKGSDRPCSYAFVVEESEFESLSREGIESDGVPMVVDWSIGDMSCHVAQKLDNYSCLGNNSKCVDSKTGIGYICQCLPGFAGNPYFPHGCQVSQNILPLRSEPKIHKSDKTKSSIAIGAAVSAVLLIIMISGVFWRRKRMIISRETELRKLDLKTGFFTLTQIKTATNNFDPANKIGEGGFGPVYKGILRDGTLIAVKQLSSRSKQGNREFVTEIGTISGLRHPNLVRLYGCCVERNQLFLVYEYMENNSLAHCLFGSNLKPLNLDWTTRKNICLGVAKGLAFLHEESVLKIVHRDIKTSNILLDKDLSAKISDFGLAKLHETENTHVSTRITGTIGYMAPEYAQWGHLTFKADVYSFGVVALEIIAGKSNMNHQSNHNCICLVNWALVLQQEGGNLIELVDPKLGSDYDEKEVIKIAKVALLCLNHSPALRPNMSEIVSMLEEELPCDKMIRDRITHGKKMSTLEDNLTNQIVEWNSDKESHSLIRSSHDLITFSTSSTSTSFTDFHPR